MKILITGSEGFVGTHFKSALADHDLTCIDIKSGIDCRDFFKTDDTYFDMVIHLAAIVGGRQTIENSPLAVAVDLSIDAEMFNWALRTRPGKLVYFSSSAAYPVKAQRYKHLGLLETNINLNDISSPDLTYGWAKLTGEYQAKFAREAGLNVYVFRPFSGYGADQSLDYPFPSFLDRARRKEDPFVIWGDGTQERDFIHISDIVNAVIEITKYPSEHAAINLCTGVHTSFNTLAQMVCQEVGYAPKILHLLDKPVGVKYRHGDPNLMLKYYKPKISLLEGIRISL